MKLKGKVAIVTGGGRGIGRAIALAFAQEGATVVINALHTPHATEVANEIKKAGGVAIGIGGDVSSARDAGILIDTAIEKFKKIDILVNNAGIVRMDPIPKVTESEWDKILSVNLKGNFLCSQAASMVMKTGSKIINVSSIAGEVGFSQLAPYCASKGGMIELTREMAIELAPKITVNAIAPGVIDTDMTKKMLEDKKTKRGFLASIPLGRIGKPEDIAGAAVFLASEDADYITGQILTVDGGWTAR